MQAFCSCSGQGFLYFWCAGFHWVVSLVAENELQGLRLTSCITRARPCRLTSRGTQAWLFQSTCVFSFRTRDLTCDLCTVDDFLTTGPPGKSLSFIMLMYTFCPELSLIVFSFSFSLFHKTHLLNQRISQDLPVYLNSSFSKTER